MISKTSQAILLLTAYLPGAGKEGPKPLSTRAYNHLIRWLSQQEETPEVLLSPEGEKLISEWQSTVLTPDHVIALLQRGGALALAMDKWERAGIWVINRSEEAYPQQIKVALKAMAPPLFFGVGEAKLLTTPSIGVVGSRAASETDISLTRQLGRQIADGAYSVVSGAAKGVDEASMLGALEAEGTAIGYLSDSLLRKANSRTYRDHLMHKNLVLLSPYSPEARFNVGNAMGRNKYIYLQSEATVVIHSGKKGGTWTGAEENLRQGWVPLWIKETDDPEAGNAQLISMGGKALPDDAQAWVPELLVEKPPSSPVQGSLFFPPETTPPPSPSPLFQLFLQELKSAFPDQDVSPERVSQQMNLTQEQVRVWLETATAHGQLKKLSPSGYQWK